MDESAHKSLDKWPNVPHVYGWLALDARGHWLLRNPASGAFERIANTALRAYIARNYEADARGAWYFQNGPQRVFVRLERTPLVFRLESASLVDHCGRSAGILRGAWLDEYGALLIAGERGAGVLDDRDLGAACGYIVDHHGAPLEEGPLTALLAGDRRFTAYLACGGARLALERINGAALAARFGFIPEPSP